MVNARNSKEFSVARELVTLSVIDIFLCLQVSAGENLLLWYRTPPSFGWLGRDGTLTHRQQNQLSHEEHRNYVAWFKQMSWPNQILSFNIDARICRLLLVHGKPWNTEVILGLENFLMPCVNWSRHYRKRKSEQVQRWAKMENHEVPEKKKWK